MVKSFDDKDPERCHLVIFTIGKRRDRDVVSKYGAYFAYKGLCEKICPNYKPDDLLFPYNPYTAHKELLIDSGLRYSANGDRKDLKSYRHYYIMTALQQGLKVEELVEQVDVSHDIIRNHYARHLQPTMFREKLIKVHHLQNP